MKRLNPYCNRIALERLKFQKNEKIYYCLNPYCNRIALELKKLKKMQEVDAVLILIVIE